MSDEKSGAARKRIEGKNWEPAEPAAKDALNREERSLDIGESGQHAPGGYYNQQGVNQPDRPALDPDNKSDKF